MIRLENICFSYTKQPFIAGLSMEMEDGQITGILGPNGSGKSTCLRLCAGLLRPAGGTVRADGDSICSLTPRQAARRIAYLPQSRITPMITVRSLVSNGRFPYLGISRHACPDDEKAIKNALVTTGMTALADRRLSTLSGGERQKAYIAMLIAQGAPNMLLDEPTTFLDIGHQLELMEILSALRASGKCIAIVLHDINMALDICDTVHVMDNGKLIYSGTSAGLPASGAVEAAYGVRPLENRASKFERLI